MPVIPPIMILALGAAAAAGLLKLMAKHRQRVNDELDALRAQKAPDLREARVTLRRDPRTGIYRP